MIEASAPILAALSVPTLLTADAAMAAKLIDMLGNLAINLVVALLIVAAAWIVARWASQLVVRALGRLKGTQHDATLPGFLGALTRWIILIIGLIMVLQRLGVQTTSIIAVLGAASLAIGLALQGALSNVAAGVLLLILRPYRVGDQVEIGPHQGVVKRLDLFITEIATFDNRRVTAPNNKILGDFIVTRTAYRRRRVDVAFNVRYDADLDKIFSALIKAARGVEDVLEDPAPSTEITAFKENVVEITLHAWVKTSDYSTAKPDVILAAKRALDRAGVVLPNISQAGAAAPAAAD
jgi:small conductance mechanosensitive channel